MASIAEDPHRPYYESWSKALESLVVDMDLATATALDAATPRRRRNVPPCSWMSVTPAVASPTHPVDLDEGADGEAGGAQAGAAGQAIGKPSAR